MYVIVQIVCNPDATEKVSSILGLIQPTFCFTILVRPPRITERRCVNSLPQGNYGVQYMCRFYEKTVKK